jgi:hypothetical protein
VAGTNTNIGGGDFIHGEAGDDIVHGMTGNDALFGDGQDDDLYGEEGYDWISGGAGDDGILGDDGLLFTSRNGTAEPLYGIAATTQAIISTPGDLQMATINVTGELAKAADLEPFWIGHNDVIYGGLGNDFIHAGMGDDAVSGAEALAFYYVDDPLALLSVWYDVVGDVLQHDYRTGSGEFAYYDEYDPWRRIQLRDVPVTGEFLLDGASRVEFLLNFEARLDPADAGPVIDDGKDSIFGDGGSDWLVGGTNHDRLFGGWGDDLLQADDDLDSTVGSGDDDANNAPDARTGSPTFADIAYGGAGRDVLIANTGADRLIDWVGEFNSYIVPFSPYGAFAISRAPAPHIREYLYDLSAASGIDLTISGNPTRNGEPYGELGLVYQADPDWHAQTGAPADPQPGSFQGPRDVLRHESFADGVAELFAVETGDWTVRNGRYESTAVPGGDAVSVFYVDYLVPDYFEIVASMSTDKPKKGFDATAYVIFDYQSPTDFKFAGIDVGLNKIQIGHRTGGGWVVDVQKGMKLSANRNYELTVVVDGAEVTLWVDGATSLSYVFNPALNEPGDPYSGYVDPLSDGYLGLGSVESVVGTTEFRVQVPTPPITLTVTDTFEGSTNLLAGSGLWQLDAGGFEGLALGASPAVATVPFDIAPAALLELETAFATSAIGGVAFDVYGSERFKFIVVSAATGELLIGHFTSAGWVVDEAVLLDLGGIVPLTLRVALLGNVATVWFDETKVAIQSFNSLLNDGDVGLIARSGEASFEFLTMRTDDPALRGSGLPDASIGDVAVAEGDAGTATVIVTVTLSEAATTPVTIGYATADDSATAGDDYLSASGTVSFSPGETTATISIEIRGSTDFEGDEAFRVVLGTAEGAALRDGIGVVTITNDDSATLPTITASPEAVAEGDAGTTSMVVTLTLSAPSTEEVTVEFRTVGGSATEATDYGGVAGVATFAPGDTEVQVAVDVTGDTLYEADETLVFALSNASGAVIGTSATLLTIVNDDAAPLVSIAASDVAASEQGADPATFTLTRSANLTGAIAVALDFAGPAAFGIDYTVTVAGGAWDISSRTVTLADGAATATITITPIDDSSPEGTEDVVIGVLAGAGYAASGPAAAASITDNDQALPALSIGDVSIVEGDRGGAFVYLSVTLSVPSTSTVTVTVRTVEGTATATKDFKPYVGTIEFAPGVTGVTIKIRVLGDRKREGDEQFFVELSSPVGAAISDGLATVTIVDNDGALMAASAAAAADAPALALDAVAPVLTAAIEAWGVVGVEAGSFEGVTVRVADLADRKLAETRGSTIYLDVTAADWGWFVDGTPADSTEYTVTGKGLIAGAGSAAQAKIDLLSVLVHELGHILGLDHDSRWAVMADVLDAGTRLLPDLRRGAKIRPR